MEVRYLVCVRVAALCLLLYTSFTFNYQAVIAAVCFTGSLVFLQPTRRFTVRDQTDNRNPLKGKPPADTQLNPDLCGHIQKAVSDLVTYDADHTPSLHEFNVVKSNTECIFAKKSRLWGSPPWNVGLSLEENVFRLVPTFLKFTMACEALGLDGFVVMLPQEYSSDIKTFGAGVQRVLRAVSGHDPRGLDCMADTDVHRRGWVYRFHTHTFFITTFAPCYPETHSRYNFESRHGFILFQPEISFAQHDIPEDSPHTDWDHPQNIRDRIRLAFRDAGRGYRIRDTVAFPMVHDIVKPVDDGVTEYIEWWKDSWK